MLAKTLRKKRLNDFKKQDIIQAAERIILDKGLMNITMDDVAKGAGYTKRTVYRYFDSKEELLMELFIHHSLLKWEFQKNEMLKTDNGLARLFALGKSYLHYYQNNRSFLQISIYFDLTGFNLEERSDLFKISFEKLYQMDCEASLFLVDAINQAKSQGQIHPDYQPDYIKNYLYYSLRTIANQYLNPPPHRQGFTDERFYTDFLDILLSGLKMKH